ncbi:hypothetical protein V6U81_04725 [Micromonospora sp. CPCC 205711]|uniref:hypothetical protein n=1 Tax=Micromonospora sp. CPCC 205547 TaxID=3122400 RepID=UPI002FEF3A77
MTQDDLERALRETLSRRVAVPPPPAFDPAGQAIRRARRARRRTTVAGLALAGVATAVITAGTAQLGGQAGRPDTPTVVLGDPRDTDTSGWPIAPVPPARPAGGTVDLINGTALVSEGKSYELGVGPAERAQRLPDHDGWLVVSATTTAGRTLWFVPTGGAPRALLAGAEEIAVAPDGRQVAWRDGGRLLAAGIVAGQLIATVQANDPAGVVPTRFVGDRVLVRPAAGGYALWRPGQSNTPGTNHPDVLDVYGERPDGRLVGLIRSAGRSCPALLSADLTPVAVRCGPALAGDGRGGVSADGRWLLANGRIASVDGALLVDLAGVTPVAWPAGPVISGAVAWTGAESAAYVDRSGALAQLRPDLVLAGERASTTLVGGGSDARPVLVTGDS